MAASKRPEYGICEIFRGDRVTGLGFAIDRAHVITCAHVVNSALGRAAKREPAPPGKADIIRVRFAIGSTTGDDGYRAASVSGWLPAEASTFDANDIAVLELTEAAPAHVHFLRPVGFRPLMPVQMWGPQPGRRDGGHVKGELLGEVRGGRIQISVGGGAFRVRPGFSGGPVWEPASGDVAGVLSACGAEDDAADAYLLGTDRVATAWPDWRPDDGSGHGAGRDLLDEVAAAARHHPDFAHAEIRRAGDHLVAAVEVRAGSRVLGTDRQPIGVQDGDVTADVVNGFAAVVASYRQSGGGTAVGTLVYTGQPASPALRDLAARSGVDLRSLAEFQTGVDLRPFAERQNQELTADQRYPQQGYVPQRYTEPPDPAVAGPALIESLLGWLAEPDGHLVVALAPFGHGKTYLLHELARRIYDEPGYPAIPVLVRLRDLEKNHEVDDLVAEQLRRGGERQIDMDRLEYLRREGRIVLLFDGFDELARRVSYDQAAAHLTAIVQAAEGRAKVVLTSRREYFLTDQDAPAALGRRLLTVAGRRVVQITDFDPGQIRAFLTARLGAEDAGKFTDLLQSTHLLGLAANPRMLSLLTGIGMGTLTQMGRSGTAITKASVFDRVLEDWLGGEYERLNPHGSLPGPWVAALRKAVTALAVQLWSNGAASLTPADLEAQAGDLTAVPGSERLDLDQAVHVLGSGSILVRVGNGEFDFVHRSIMEWLAAEAIASRLGQQAEHDMLVRLTSRPLTSLQIDLLAEIAGLAGVSGWVQEAVKEANDQVRGNALAAAQQLGIAIAQPPVLRGQDLRGQDLTGRDLAGADLSAANLTDALLDGADLRRANLTGAVLVRTRLDRAVLSGAVLDQADLHDARLPGADLRSVAWQGLRSAWRATTVGAQADQAALTALAAAGATLPDNAAELQSSGAGTTGTVGLSFSPDGELLAAACDSNVQLWQVATGLMARLLSGHLGDVTAVAWSPDGRYIASAGCDATVRVWDARTGRPVHVLDCTAHVNSICWSPDSQHIASSSRDKTLRIWEAGTGRQVRALALGTSPDSVAWSPDGRHLAADHHEGVQIWNPATGQHLKTLACGKNWIYALAWSPDSTRLAAGGSQSVLVWKTDTSEQVFALNYMRGMPKVAWSPDSRYLLFGTSHEPTTVWDSATGTRIQRLSDDPDNASALAWSPDGRCIAVGDREFQSTIGIWDARTWKQIHVLGARTSEIDSVAWSPDGREIAAGGTDGNARIWNARTGEFSRVHEISSGHHSMSHPVAWSPDGRSLAYGTVRSICVIDVATGTETSYDCSGTGRTVIGYSGAVAWSPDGRYFAHGNNFGAVWIFDANARSLRQAVMDLGTVRSLSWSRDNHLAIAHDGDEVQIRSAGSFSLTQTLTGESARRVDALSWSPDGRYLATGSRVDDEVCVWDTHTGALARQFPERPGWITSVAWSPDGQFIAASSDNTIAIWNAQNGSITQELTAISPVSSVAWSPDSRSIACGNSDNTVQLWDAVNGRCLATLTALADGYAVLHDKSRYSFNGTVRGEFWWTVGLSRFEIGELEKYLPGQGRIPTSTPVSYSQP